MCVASVKAVHLPNITGWVSSRPTASSAGLKAEASADAQESSSASVGVHARTQASKKGQVTHWNATDFFRVVHYYWARLSSRAVMAPTSYTGFSTGLSRQPFQAATNVDSVPIVSRV